MFAFVFTATPTAAALGADGIAGAHAHLFVDSDDRGESEAAARAYLMHLGWLVADVQSAVRLDPSQFPGLEPPEAAAVRRASAEGIYAWFVGWPVATGADDTVVEVRPLPTPFRPTESN
jgi:hypothetical protein